MRALRRTVLLVLALALPLAVAQGSSTPDDQIAALEARLAATEQELSRLLQAQDDLDRIDAKLAELNQSSGNGGIWLIVLVGGVTAVGGGVLGYTLSKRSN